MKKLEKNIRSTVSQVLENMSEIIGLETGSVMLWGEVEIPECIRKELEEKQQQE